MVSGSRLCCIGTYMGGGFIGGKLGTGWSCNDNATAEACGATVRVWRLTATAAVWLLTPVRITGGEGETVGTNGAPLFPASSG